MRPLISSLDTSQQQAYANSRTIGWWVVTTAMITAVPLIMEVMFPLRTQCISPPPSHNHMLSLSFPLSQYNRELQLEELEKLQIAKALAEGATPAGLAQQGLTSAVEPKVLR